VSHTTRVVLAGLLFALAVAAAYLGIVAEFFIVPFGGLLAYSVIDAIREDG
jgi:hypothetical protein